MLGDLVDVVILYIAQVRGIMLGKTGFSNDVAQI